NDWTHDYYFRALGSHFQRLEDASREETPGRQWIVYTAQVPPEKRLAVARTFAPDGWQVLEQRDFRFTTVLLLAPPPEAAAPAARRGRRPLGTCRRRHPDVKVPLSPSPFPHVP